MVLAQPSASVFAALGDKVRLQLVSRLCEGGPMSITQLSSGFAVTRQAIAKHLRVMERAGLAKSVRSGRESVWQLDKSPIDDTRRYLDQISNQWDDALARLRAMVET